MPCAPRGLAVFLCSSRGHRENVGLVPLQGLRELGVRALVPEQAAAPRVQDLRALRGALGPVALDQLGERRQFRALALERLHDRGHGVAEAVQLGIEAGQPEERDRVVPGGGSGRRCRQGAGPASRGAEARRSVDAVWVTRRAARERGGGRSGHRPPTAPWLRVSTTNSGSGASQQPHAPLTTVATAGGADLRRPVTGRLERSGREGVGADPVCGAGDPPSRRGAPRAVPRSPAARPRTRGQPCGAGIVSRGRGRPGLLVGVAVPGRLARRERAAPLALVRS